MQATIKKFDGDVKETMRAEKAQRAETKADDLARYLVAAWKFQAVKQKDPKASALAFAKTEKLDQAVLGRCAKFVEKAGAGVRDDAQEGRPGEGSRRRRPDHAQKQVKSLIGQKGKLDKMKEDLLNGLFYADNSVFQLSDQQVRGMLSEDKKKKLDEMSATLALLQKDEHAKPLPFSPWTWRKSARPT